MGIGKDLTFYGNIKMVSLEMLCNEISRAQLLSASAQTNLKPHLRTLENFYFLASYFRKCKQSH